MMRSFLFTLTAYFICINSHAQTIASFEVPISKATNGIEIPVNVNLDEITFLPDSVLSLIEIRGNKKIPTAFQISQGKQRNLYWLVTPGNEATKKRTYQLVKGAPATF